MTDFQFLVRDLKELGFQFETQSPGDGKTRYRLVNVLGRTFARAIGRKEALAVGRAFLAGIEEQKRRMA